MAANDLTTLDAVREWREIPDNITKDDKTTCRLITAMSGIILGALNRSTLRSKTYNEIYNGPGGTTLQLKNWPVTSIISLNSGGIPITARPASQPNGPGYSFDAWDGAPAGNPTKLYLSGYSFPRGNQNNVSVSYVAGYLVQGESAIIGANSQQVFPQNPWGSCVADAGVINAATGLPMVVVDANPLTGQYVPPAPLAGNDIANKAIRFYQFSPADAGLAVILSYSYTPSIIEQCCIEWCTERLEYRTRPGQTSKTVGSQETMAFDLSAVPKFVAAALQNYKSVAFY